MPDRAEPAPSDLPCSLVLVGLMGAGKTAVGRGLARALRLSFRDADWEIEAAAGMPVAEIFDRFGEPAFRDLERRVIARLLKADAQVLALGGGAFMDEETRAVVAACGRSIWLRASPETLVGRTERRRAQRPLLRDGDPLERLRALAAVRDPVYALADIVIESDGKSVKRVVDEVIKGLNGWRPGTSPRP